MKAESPAFFQGVKIFQKFRCTKKVFLGASKTCLGKLKYRVLPELEIIICAAIKKHPG
jgi:hypothetical protein